jgi:hypothetical protein
MSVERQRLVTISPLRSGLNVPSLSASGRQALSASLALSSSQLTQTQRILHPLRLAPLTSDYHSCGDNTSRRVSAA